MNLLYSLNWLDYVLILVLGLSAASAFRKGFSREIVGLITSVLAIVLAMWFYGLAGSSFRAWVDSDRAANLIGFFAVVVAVWIVGSLFGWIVHRFLRSIGLSWFDRLLGMSFGLLRGTLIAMALLTGYMSFGPHQESKQDGANTLPDSVVHSRIAPYVLQASRLFVAMAPMDLKESFHTRYLQAQSAWKLNTAENGTTVVKARRKKEQQ